MSQIGMLQMEVSKLKKERAELEREEEGLLEFQKENQMATKKVQEQITSKYKYGEKFYDLKSETTIAQKLGDKVTRRYGAINKKRVLLNYDGIAEEIAAALKKVKSEIKECTAKITSTEATIRLLQLAENKQNIQDLER